MTGLIGSDPELIILANNNRVRAATFFPSLEERVGKDGNGYPLEFRPPPSRTVDDHLSEIKLCFDILEHGIRTNPFFQDKEVRVIAGAYHTGCAIGGHIHLDSPGNIINRGQHISEFIYGFNYLVARDDALKRRNDSSYGRPSDIRTKNSARNIAHYEIRSPDSWLVSPMWAGAYLSLAWLSNDSYDFLYESKPFAMFINSILSDDPLSKSVINETKREDYRNMFLDIVDELKRGSPYYSSVKKYMDFASEQVGRGLTCPTWMNTLQTWSTGKLSPMRVEFIREDSWTDIKQELIIPSSSAKVLFYSIVSKDKTIWLNGDFRDTINVGNMLKKSGLKVGIGNILGRKLSIGNGLIVGVPAKIRKTKRATDICQNIINTIHETNNNERRW